MFDLFIGKATSSGIPAGQGLSDTEMKGDYDKWNIESSYDNSRSGSSEYDMDDHCNTINDMRFYECVKNETEKITTANVAKANISRRYVCIVILQLCNHDRHQIIYIYILPAYLSQSDHKLCKIPSRKGCLE